MPCAELQLAFRGEEDMDYLTGNPQITFFVFVYKRYTNFAIENIEEVLEGNPMFGGKSYVKLGRYGDLISKMYLDVVLPSLNPTNNPSYAISWVNSIGHALIKKLELEIGGNIIDTQYGIFMEINDELTIPSEKKYGYYDMIGKHSYFNVTMQQKQLHLRIPLFFWFCTNIGLSLPNIALQNSEIRLIITFNDFNQLWVSSTGKLTPFINPKEISITSVNLLTDYIFLDDDERRLFVSKPHQYLIEQVSRNYITTSLNATNNIIQLDEFEHPVKELIWVFRRCSSINNHVPGGGNELFNFSDRPTYLSLQQEDPMTSAIIYFEGNYRFWPARDAKYFREVEPYSRHHNIPDNFIYIYSFSLKPDEDQPTGTCNFSKIDNSQLNVIIKETVTNDIDIHIFAPCYNILIIDGGMACLKYGY